MAHTKQAIPLISYFYCLRRRKMMYAAALTKPIMRLIVIMGSGFISYE